jgi:hypothetical protein
MGKLLGLFSDIAGLAESGPHETGGGMSHVRTRQVLVILAALSIASLAGIDRAQHAGAAASSPWQGTVTVDNTTNLDGIPAGALHGVFTLDNATEAPSDNIYTAQLQWSLDWKYEQTYEGPNGTCTQEWRMFGGNTEPAGVSIVPGAAPQLPDQNYYTISFRPTASTSVQVYTQILSDTCGQGSDPAPSGVTMSEIVKWGPPADNTESNLSGVATDFDGVADYTVTLNLHRGPQADIAARKSLLTPEPISNGQTVTYRVTVENKGPDDAPSATMSDTFAGLTPTDARPLTGHCTWNESSVTCDLGAISSGASTTVDVDFTTSATSPNIANVASASSPLYDPDPSNNTARVDTPLHPATGYLVIKEATTPAGNAQTFAFTGAVSATLGDGQATNPITVPAGINHVTQAPVDKWLLSSITCQDPTNDSTHTGSTLNANVSPNETVTCTFNNQKRTQLTLSGKFQHFVVMAGGVSLINPSGGHNQGNTDSALATEDNPQGSQAVKEVCVSPSWTFSMTRARSSTGFLYNGTPYAPDPYVADPRHFSPPSNLSQTIHADWQCVPGSSITHYAPRIMVAADLGMAKFSGIEHNLTISAVLYDGRTFFCNIPNASWDSTNTRIRQGSCTFDL